MARQALSLVECFQDIEDPRIERTKHHLLTDILCLAVLAVVAGADGWEDIEEFGKQKRDWLKKYLRLPHRIPSHDTISRVFCRQRDQTKHLARQHPPQTKTRPLKQPSPGKHPQANHLRCGCSVKNPSRARVG